MSGRLLSCTLGLLAVLAGCASSPALRAAKRGDRLALLGQVKALDKGQLHDVAVAVGAREIAGERPRIAEGAACAYQYRDALRARAKIADGPGAEATLALLDAGGTSARGIDRGE